MAGGRCGPRWPRPRPSGVPAAARPSPLRHMRPSRLLANAAAHTAGREGAAVRPGNQECDGSADGGAGAGGPGHHPLRQVRQAPSWRRATQGEGLGPQGASNPHIPRPVPHQGPPAAPHSSLGSREWRRVLQAAPHAAEGEPVLTFSCATSRRGARSVWRVRLPSAARPVGLALRKRQPRDNAWLWQSCRSVHSPYQAGEPVSQHTHATYKPCVHAVQWYSTYTHNIHACRPHTYTHNIHAYRPHACHTHMYVHSMHTRCVHTDHTCDMPTCTQHVCTVHAYRPHT